MKRLLTLILTIESLLPAKADDGHRLWLRYDTVRTATVTLPTTQHPSPTIDIARHELETFYDGESVVLRLDPTMADDDGFSINDGITDGPQRNVGRDTITARRPIGLLYGAYQLLREQATRTAPAHLPAIHSVTSRGSHPVFALRLLNHWDNLDGSIERGYAGESIFEWFHLNETLIKE